MVKIGLFYFRHPGGHRDDEGGRWDDEGKRWPNRATPLASTRARGYLRAMTAATEIGAIVYPPVPAFYARPSSLEQMVDHTLGRVLDLFGIDNTAVSRWGGLNSIKNTE